MFYQYVVGVGVEQVDGVGYVWQVVGNCCFVQECFGYFGGQVFGDCFQLLVCVQGVGIGEDCYVLVVIEDCCGGFQVGVVCVGLWLDEVYC